MQSYEHCIREALPDASIEGTIPEDASFNIDSRTVTKQTIFVALHGEHRDGHEFVKDALERGALGAILARHKKDFALHQVNKELLRKKVIITVSDPLHALISFALHWRAQFSYPVIGVTGSVGKTSAKENIAKLFSLAGRSYVASYGNQNTQIGLALNILRMRSHHEVAVFELGINRRGEMAQLARMAKPTIGIITSIGHCHMEGLGSLQDISAEKRDIFKYFTERDIGIVDGDQQLLSVISYPHPVIKVGYKATNQIHVRKVRFVGAGTRCMIKLYKDKYEVMLSNSHVGTIHRALFTAAVGHLFQIPHEHIIAAVQEPITVSGRFERRILSLGNGTVIDDCYNANPESMKAALAAFQEIRTAACKVAVLGDMLELGVNSPFWHRQIGRFLRKITSLEKLILVGDMVRYIQDAVPFGIEMICVATWQEALKVLPDVIGDQEVMMLVKGSHSMGLSNLITHCTK